MKSLDHRKELLDTLNQCRNVFRDARKSVYEGARLLHRIHTESLWEGQFSSFSEYVEGELGISKSYASKLVQSWQFYVIDNKVSPRNLEGTDPEKLYLALNIPGSAEKKLASAATLTRRELRDELASDEHGDCSHETLIQICARCGRRV